MVEVDVPLAYRGSPAQDHLGRRVATHPGYHPFTAATGDGATCCTATAVVVQTGFSTPHWFSGPSRLAPAPARCAAGSVTFFGSAFQITAAKRSALLRGCWLTGLDRETNMSGD